MKNLPALPSSFSSILKPIAEHHAIIGILVILGMLIYAVYAVNEIINIPTDEAYRTKQQNTSVITSFDKETIDKLELLQARQDPRALDLPTGRLNPFAE